MSREELLQHLAELCGQDVVRIRDPGDGWPGMADVRLDGGIQPVALHVGRIGGSHRGRGDVERRFQNPSQNRPVESPTGHLPLLLGLWEASDRPVVVGMDASIRVGKETRQSFFVPLAKLRQAEAIGWSEHHSATGELIVCFHPALLPAYVQVRSTNAVPEGSEIQRLIEASGLTEEDTAAARQRARHAASRLARDAAFKQVVLAAYQGECAVCGLNFGLLDAAHIYPVAAPGSPDEVWNGMALCGTHHAAFDRYVLWVEPDSKRLVIHPEIVARADESQISRQFVGSVGTELRQPREDASRPRAEMFERRYAHFGDKYAWAT